MFGPAKRCLAPHDIGSISRFTQTYAAFCEKIELNISDSWLIVRDQLRIKLLLGDRSFVSVQKRTAPTAVFAFFVSGVDR